MTIPARCHHLGCTSTIETPASRPAREAAIREAGWFYERRQIGRHVKPIVLCPTCRGGKA